MASRKQKIKSKREQEQAEIRQVRIAVGIFAAIIVIGIAAYVINDSGILKPPFDYPGTPEEICEHETPANGGGQNGQYSAAPEMALEDDVDYRVVFCTSEGAIYLDLFEEDAPETVNNMVFLANEGYYNNTVFHRVLEGFMAQGGDPTGSGSGGPGYQFDDEVFDDLTFDRPYLLAMANAGAGTNGSQFFITFDQTPHLNGLHTIFGEVISGQSAVDSLNRVNPQQPNPNTIPSDLFTAIIVTADQVTEE